MGRSQMIGNVCLVTGASAGIGEETAVGLGQLGAHVLLACRDRRRGEAALRRVRRTGARCELFVADLSSQRQIANLAAAVARAHPRLHVLVHNAAILPQERSESTDGIELQLAVNHLAPFLLTRMLLPALKAAAPSRIIVVASQVEAQGCIDFDDLQARWGYEPLRAYFQSKLANVMFTYELARRLEGSGVTANCLHPGVINTNLLCDYNAQHRVLGRLQNWRWHKGPKEGAQTTLRLASDPTLTGVSGRYFRPDGEAESSPSSRHNEAQRRLWEASEALIRI